MYFNTLVQIFNLYFNKYTGKDIVELEKATDRDKYMTPYEAQEFNIIDGVIAEKSI